MFQSVDIPKPGAPDAEDIEGGVNQGADWFEQLMGNPIALRLIAILIIAALAMTMWKHTWVKLIVILGLGIVIGTVFLS